MKGGRGNVRTGEKATERSGLASSEERGKRIKRSVETSGGSRSHARYHLAIILITFSNASIRRCCCCSLYRPFFRLISSSSRSLVSRISVSRQHPTIRRVLSIFFASLLLADFTFDASSFHAHAYNDRYILREREKERNLIPRRDLSASLSYAARILFRARSIRAENARQNLASFFSLRLPAPVCVLSRVYAPATSERECLNF